MATPEKSLLAEKQENSVSGGLELEEIAALLEDSIKGTTKCCATGTC